MEYLKIFTDFAEAIEPLSDAEKGRLFIAMLLYARQGTEPQLLGNERILWPTAKLNIDREAAFLLKQRENGAKGGRPKNPTIPTETQVNPPKPNESQKDKDNDKEKIISSPSGKNTPARHKYGQYNNVLLSDEELAKLKAEFPDWQQRIERLSEYIASSGKSYKSHLATIRAWARKDTEKAPAKDSGAWAKSAARQRLMKEQISGKRGPVSVSQLARERGISYEEAERMLKGG